MCLRGVTRGAAIDLPQLIIPCDLPSAEPAVSPICTLEPCTLSPIS